MCCTCLARYVTRLSEKCFYRLLYTAKCPKIDYSPIPGFPDSRIPRFPDSPIPGFPDSRIPRFPDSRIPPFPDSPIPGFPDSPFPVLKIAAFCENVELRSEVDSDKNKTTADIQYHEMTDLSSMARSVNKTQIQGFDGE